METLIIYSNEIGLSSMGKELCKNSGCSKKILRRNISRRKGLRSMVNELIEKTVAIMTINVHFG